jgi:hypothetical protein
VTLPGGVLAAIGMLWFAFTIDPALHYIIPVIGSGVFGAGLCLTFSGVFTYLVRCYPAYAASCLAANSFMRCSFACAFPLFAPFLYAALGFRWASAVLAFLTVAMVPFPFLFYRYGHAIREKSRFYDPTMNR